MQYGIWHAAHAVAPHDFTPWVSAIAHLLSGMFAAAVAAIAVPDAKTARHRRRPQPAGRPG